MKKVLLSLAAVTAIAAAAAPAAAQPYGVAYGWHQRHDYNSDLTVQSLNARQAKIAAKIDMAVRDGQLRPNEANRLMVELRRIDVQEYRFRDGRYSQREREVILQRLNAVNSQLERMRYNDRRYSYGYGNRW